MRLAYSGLCPFARLMQLNPMIMVPTNDIPEASASGFNDRLDRSVVIKLNRRVMKAEESGIMRFLSKTTNSKSTPINPHTNMLVGEENIRICMLNHIEKEETIVIDKKIHDFQILFTVYRYAIFVALIILLLEAHSVVIT